MSDPFWRFAFDWAYGLGEPDVPGLLASTPLPLFMDWQEWWTSNPPTEERADWRAAMLACVVASLVKGKGQRAPTITDFMPNFGARQAHKQTPAQMKAVLMAFAGAQNAFVKQGEK